MRVTQIWQLLDSAFPSGSFAHSAGLEAAWQSGEAGSDSQLEAFVRESLWQTGHCALPFVTVAHREPARYGELDWFCDAVLTNAVANRASRSQGRAFLTACARIWPSARLSNIDATARRGGGHQAPTVGVVLRALDVPLDEAQRIFLFTGTRTICAAAVRLGIIGPYRAQRMQYECQQHLDAVIERCGELDVDQVSQTAPMIDLLQSTHDRLYSRLFQS